MAAGKSGQQDQYQQRMITVPQVDAMRGRQLFVTKGCITCHSIKGVGGKAAPALDASQEGEPVDEVLFNYLQIQNQRFKNLLETNP